MRQATYDDHVERVGAVVRAVHDRLDTGLTVSEAAETCYMALHHFQRVFARVAGEGYARMGRRFRLERAAWQLRETDLSVTEIAYEAGFVGVAPFARAFRRFFGCTAVQLRNARQVVPRLFTPNGAHFTPNGSPDFVPLCFEGSLVEPVVREVGPTEVLYREHRGPVHRLGETWLALTAEMERQGHDWREGPLVAFSRRLGRYTPVARLRVSVGVPWKPGMKLTGALATLGGGPCLTVRHPRETMSLEDFWMRVWAEVLPSTGLPQAQAPCFQFITFSNLAGAGQVAETDLFVPLETN